MKKTKYLMYMSLLVTLALVLSLIERNIPTPFMTPGAKLGLANLVTVLALYSLKCYQDTAKVIITRLLLAAIFGGGIMQLMYSSAGAALSFLSMIGVKDSLKDRVSMIGVSITGAVFHNIGQIIVACIIMQNVGIVIYLPFLTFTGIVTGGFIGLSAQYIIEYIYKYIKKNGTY